VITDVDMPHMNGFLLTEAIRGSKRFKNLPVILVTGQESEEDKVRGMEAGANAYLLKSAFDQKALLETIGQLL
jgi:two-component system, chemotaxis family, sensor kinase CheA